jgi:hypothetical protein
MSYKVSLASLITSLYSSSEETISSNFSPSSSLKPAFSKPSSSIVISPVFLLYLMNLVYFGSASASVSSILYFAFVFA